MIRVHFMSNAKLKHQDTTYIANFGYEYITLILTLYLCEKYLRVNITGVIECVNI